MKFSHRTLAALALVVLVLNACSSRPAATSPSPTLTPERASTTGAVSPTSQRIAETPVRPEVTRTPGPLTLTYWEAENPDGDVLLDELGERFMTEHPDIIVRRLHISSEELRLQFPAAAAAGEAPTLVRAAGEFTGPFSQLGILSPVDDLFDQPFLDQFFPGALDAARARGHLWGVPDNYGGHLMLIYNQQLVDVVPTDTDAWIAQLKALTIPDQGQYGLVYNMNEPYWVIPWIGGFGGWPLDRQDQPMLNTRSVVAALQFVHDLKFVHRVTPAQADYETAYDYFRQGRAAYLIDGTWNLERLETSGVDFGLTALPTVSATSFAPTPLTTGQFWLISAGLTDDELAAAREFVAFMTSAEAQQAWLTRLTRLPSHKAVARDAEAGDDSLLAGSIKQLSQGRGLPPVPEMFCVWDAMRPHLEAVMADALAPAVAADLMQQDAQQCVAEMQGLTAPADAG